MGKLGNEIILLARSSFRQSGSYNSNVFSIKMDKCFDFLEKITTENKSQRTTPDKQNYWVIAHLRKSSRILLVCVLFAKLGA